MKPFVINRYGRIVFPFNFFPELDFSVFQTLEQFAAVIKRDFEEKAPDRGGHRRARGVAGLQGPLRGPARPGPRTSSGSTATRMTMYEKRPTRWRDVPAAPRRRLPAGVRAAGRRRDRRRHRGRLPGAAAHLGRGHRGQGLPHPARPLPPQEGRGRRAARRSSRRSGEILANPKNLTYHLLAYDPDYPGYGYDDIIEFSHRVPELEALMRQAMVLHNQYRWDRAKTRLTEVGQLHDDDFVVVFHPRSDDVLQFIRRVKGVHPGGRAGLCPRVAPARPPYPPVDVRRALHGHAAARGGGVYKGERPAPTTISSATPRTAGRP